MSDLPNVFIASSVEALSVAEAINIKLEYEARVKQWDNAFDLSSITITSLLKKAKETDYAIFVFHKDDKITIRNNTYSSVRDNVLFELGVFIGVLGIEKCFILIPKSVEGEFRLPTDLAGVTMTSYDDRLDDMIDAVTTSAAKIKHAIKKQKTQVEAVVSENNNSISVLLNQQLQSTQTQLWSLSHELQRAKTENDELSTSIKNYFFSVAKPATKAEIVAWENGARDSYLKEVKIVLNNVYYVDKDVIIPSGYGAGALSVIVAKGVKIYGSDKWSHNSIYYMDGFRTDSRV